MNLDGVAASGRALERVSGFVDLVRALAGRDDRVQVTSVNRFPTASGLASSASAFAALTVAALDARAASSLARRGSGSAARSIFGGFVRMHAGSADDGHDAYAEPFADARLRLGAAIAVVEAPAKDVASTAGMQHTRDTSPYHASWTALVPADLARAEAALRAGDFGELAEVVEGNCLAMHADAMAARPGLLYFRPATLFAIETVRSLRRSGTPVCFTVDAGPHVVAFTPPEHLAAVVEALEGLPGVRTVMRSGVGPDAHVTAETP